MIDINGRLRVVLMAGLAGLVCTGIPSAAESPPSIEQLREQIDRGRYVEAERGVKVLLTAHAETQGADRAAVTDLLGRLVARLLADSQLGQEHCQIARDLGDDARRVFHHLGDRQGAGKIAEGATTIAERSCGPDHLVTARLLILDGFIRLDQRELEPAGARFERALAIARNNGEAGLCAWHRSLHGLGSVHNRRGEFAAAISYYEQALEVARQAHGDNHVEVADVARALGWALYVAGDYPAAVRAYDQALAILDADPDSDRLTLLRVLFGRGNLLRRLGDFEASEAAFRRAIAIAEQLPESLVRARNLGVGYGNLFNLYAVIGGHDAAVHQLYDQALTLLAVAWGPTSNQVLECQNNYAGYLVRCGELARARELYEQVAAVREEVLGPDHQSLANTLHELAAVLRKTNETEAARRAAERALAIRERALGEHAPKVAWSLSLLARIQIDAGQFAAGLGSALRAEQIGRDTLRLTARAVAERGALQYAAGRTGGIDLALSLAAEAAPTRRSFGPQVWDAMIRSRALVLDEVARRHRAIGARDDADVARLARMLADDRALLARLTLRGPVPGSPEDHRQRLTEVRERKEQTERALAAASAEFAREYVHAQVGLEEVRAALPADSALIAYATYSHRPVPPAPVAGGNSAAPAEPVRSYLAFVLPPGGSAPAVVPLGPVARIDEPIDAWRQEVARRPVGLGPALAAAERRYRQVAGKLREAIWDPLSAWLTGADSVFVVPDGAINLVGLATLPTGDSSYLVESGPRLHLLSAERDLVRDTDRRPATGTLLALGSPDFECRPGEKPAPSLIAAGPGSTAPQAVASAAAYRGPHSDSDEFRSLAFAPLPAAREEVEQIVAIWSDHQPANGSLPGRALVLTGAAASEERFKHHASGHRVLHLATHGFFLGQQPGAAGTSENPLLRSGLVLAGANRRDEVGLDVDDGILTAEEIASLDLSGVEWAVLSACSTGVGEVMAGEGVLGLRRAFEVAGVDTTIMSLWPVQDEAARLWMERLYRGRLAGLATADAVRQASLDLLDRRRAAGKSTHPFFWGAFVAAGDWR